MNDLLSIGFGSYDTATIHQFLFSIHLKEPEKGTADVAEGRGGSWRPGSSQGSLEFG